VYVGVTNRFAGNSLRTSQSWHGSHFHPGADLLRSTPGNLFLSSLLVLLCWLFLRKKSFYVFEEITLHKAAKAAFDEAGLQKLPKVKALDAEFTELA